MGPGGFFPANPDLADILGDTDFNFRNLYFYDLFGSQISRSQISKFPEIWPGSLGPGLGRAGLEPSGPKNIDFLL